MVVLTDALAGIADALDVVLVVQRRIGDDDAADGDRGETRNRCQRARTTDLDVDVFDRRERLLGREFVGRRPAWRTRTETEPRLQVEPVDLVDDADNLVIKGGKLQADFRIMGERSEERRGGKRGVRTC